ncbi:MAG: ribulose-phosphate 3-epimerase [Clostridia bacterium]|nr:ribulose-phosphate 3-epimerase [Clostridia bacterium]
MKVSPSILTCDFGYAADEVRFVEDTGADMVHLDVMDGVFVPNISFGPAVIGSLRPHTSLFFDVHLMMAQPRRMLPAFAKAGADMLNIHLECDDPIDETLADIHALGKKAAITLKPATPAEAAFPYLEQVAMVLVMTVEPGFGGQSFMSDMLPKIAALRQEIDRRGLQVDIQVDGGINADTARLVAEAGATVAVLGSALFNAEQPSTLVKTVQAM